MKTLRYMLIAIAMWLVPFAAYAQEIGVTADNAAPGIVVLIPGYCTTVEDTARLAAAATKDNGAGYLRVMKDPDSKCYDARRMRNVRPIIVTLVEMVFSIVREDGEPFDFWSATDVTGRLVYFWIHTGGLKPEGTSASLDEAFGSEGNGG